MRLLSLSIPGSNGTPVVIQAPGGIPTGGLEAGGAGQAIIQRGITVFIIVVIIAALFSLIYSGIQWTISGGDKQALQTARNRLTYSIIGLIIGLLALFIVQFIGGLFGVDLSQGTP